MVGMILLGALAISPGSDGLRLKNLRENMNGNMTAQFFVFNNSLQNCDGDPYEPCKANIEKNVCTPILDSGGSAKLECLGDGEIKVEVWLSDDCSGDSLSDTVETDQCITLPENAITEGLFSTVEFVCTATPDSTPTPDPDSTPDKDSTREKSSEATCFSESSTLILSNGEVKTACECSYWRHCPTFRSLWTLSVLRGLSSAASEC